MATPKPVFFAMSECIEWTARVPKVGGPATRSPNFAFERKECHLKLYFESKNVSYVELCLVNQESPSVPFDVSVFVISATKSLRSERITVKNTSESVWSCRWSDVQIYLKDFCISFMINFHRSKNAKDKQSVDMLQSLEENIHLEALSRDFSNLLHDDDNYDVDITVGENTFKAHRNILSARSNFFKALLQTEMIESKTGVIELHDMDTVVFQEFLVYLYSGRIPEFTVDTAKLFYETGDKFIVEELKKTCSQFLTDNLSVANACEILSLADRHSDVDFKERVISFILEKRIPVKYENWSDFCTHHPVMANEVLNRFCKILISR